MKCVITSKGLSLGDTVRIQSRVSEYNEDGTREKLPSVGTVIHIDPSASEGDYYGVRLEGMTNTYYFLSYELEVLEPVA